MFQKSKVKLKIIEVLKSWNYQKERASPYNIAKAINSDPRYVTEILRYLKDAGFVSKKKKANWILL